VTRVQRLNPIYYLVLVLITGGVFINTLGNPFVWDDLVYVSNNSHLQKTEYIGEYFSASFCKGAARAQACAFYRPIVSLSYLFDFMVWENRPFGFHLTNVLIHVLVVCFFYFVLVRVFKNPYVAFVSALFFAVHPVRVESVAVIANRTDPTTSLFLLPSFFFFSRYLSSLKETAPSEVSLGKEPSGEDFPDLPDQEKSEVQEKSGGVGGSGLDGLGESAGSFRGRRGFFLFLSSTFFFLAILTKEVALALPLLLLLYDLFFFRPWRGAADLLFRWKTYLPYGMIILVYFVARNHALGYGLTQDLRWEESWVRILTAPAIFWDYFRLQVFPYPLKPFHGRPEWWGSATVAIAWGLIFLGSYLFLILRMGRFSKEILFGGLWFAIFLLPVLDIIPIAWPMASERYSYIPSMGFALSLGFIFNLLLKTKSAIPSLWIKGGSRVLMVLLLVIFSVLTVMRNRVWSDEILLWSDAVQKSPDFALGYMNLGLNHQKRGDFEQAAWAYERSLSNDPSNPKVYHNLGSLYERLDRTDEAIQMYQTLIEQGQAFPVTYFNLGSIFLKKKDYNNAFLFYKEAIRVDPDYYKAHLWLGRLYNRFGKKEEALHEFKEAIRIFPQRWVSYLDTGDLLYSMKRFTEAEKVYQQALIFFPPERRGSSEYGVIQERLRALRLQPVE